MRSRSSPGRKTWRRHLCMIRALKLQIQKGKVERTGVVTQKEKEKLQFYQNLQEKHWLKYLQSYIYMQIICICHMTWKIYFWNGGTRCYNLTESTEPSKAWRMVDHFPQILRNVLFESHKILNLLEKRSHEGYMYMMGVKLFPQNMLWEKNRCVPPGSITLFWKSSWFMLGYDEMD